MDVHGYKCDQNANPKLYRMISCCCLWLHYATTNKHKSMKMWMIQSWNENIATTIQNNSQQSNIMLFNRYASS
jgi:hypothetical protein